MRPNLFFAEHTCGRAHHTLEQFVNRGGRNCDEAERGVARARQNVAWECRRKR
jgi:hypothetical protein